MQQRRLTPPPLREVPVEARQRDLLAEERDVALGKIGSRPRGEVVCVGAWVWVR